VLHHRQRVDGTLVCSLVFHLVLNGCHQASEGCRTTAEDWHEEQGKEKWHADLQVLETKEHQAGDEYQRVPHAARDFLGRCKQPEIPNNEPDNSRSFEHIPSVHCNPDSGMPCREASLLEGITPPRHRC